VSLKWYISTLLAGRQLSTLSDEAGGMEDIDLPNLRYDIASSLCLKQLYKRS
jgi:hypothetical protein